MRKLGVLIAASIIVGGGGMALAKRDRNLVPEATAVGAAQSCIPIVSIRESRVRSDKVIDFRVSGKKWMRNELPYSCPSLRLEERFSYSTSLSQLCSTDIIHVLHSYGGTLQRGAGCGLGKFQPVEIAKK